MRLLPIFAILVMLATALAVIALTGCTYTISMVHTEGQASDVVDATSTPTADVDATANLTKGL